MFAEKLHSNELKALLAVLPKDHKLSEETLHKIMEWKHGSV